MNLMRLYHRLETIPGGRSLFSWMVARKAPYFRTIRGFVQEMEPGRVVVFLKKRRRIENHIRTIHAIAVCNGCELAFGMCMESGLPKHLRWLPAGMSVRYLAKAGTDLEITCNFPDVVALEPGQYQLPVEARDTHGTLVLDGEITVHVSERK